MSLPLISIIIPTFNAQAKIAASLQSIIEGQQGFASLEVLVIDGASSDRTSEIVEAWQARDSRIHWHSERDDGVYDAMNKGVARAQGEFFYFLGAGDLLRPGALQQIAAQMPPRGKQLRFVYGEMSLSDGTIYDGPFTLSKLRTENIGHQAIFYDRRLFERFGGYENRYQSFADHVFNMKCWGCRDVSPTYCSVVVADYEGGGFSDGGDPVFDRERMKLVRRHLGMRQYLLALVAKIIPYEIKMWIRKKSRQLRASQLK